MKQYLIAHDLGTSGNKATLYTTEGKLVASIVSKYATNVNKLGWAEQNPRDWWSAVCESTNALMEGRNPNDVAGISFSGQMMGCICLDSSGELLMDSLIWADTRAMAETVELADKVGEKNICSISGMRPAPNYTVEKLMWIKKNRPAIYDQIKWVLQSKDYIIYIMTGEIVTDQTDAAATQAFDIRDGKWSEEILNAVGIAPDIFPRIIASTGVVGGLLKKPAMEMGLVSGIPVIAGGGDGLCAAVGAASVYPGKGYCCLGSSSWISCSTNLRLNNEEGIIMYGPHVIENRFVLSGTMQTGALSYNWAKEKLYPTLSFEDVNSIIEETPVGSNGVLFLPYLMGERAPWWNSKVRGTYLSLGLESSAADMMRAVVEGVGLNLSIIFEEICKYEEIKELNIIGGGAKGSVWCQTLADLFGVPIYRLRAVNIKNHFWLHLYIILLSL